MRFPTIDASLGRDLLDAHRQDGHLEIPAPNFHFEGDGEEFDQERASQLLAELDLLCEDYDPDGLERGQGGSFEANASPVVHRALSIPPEVAGNGGFWRWMTFYGADGDLLRIVNWRFADRPEESRVAAANFGIENTWEGLFARLWWRGAIGHDPEAEEAYRIARLGDMDLWRSHILRVEYGRCENLSRNLIRYMYPNEGRRRIMSVKKLRELAKQLRILDATYAFEVMTDDQIQALLRTIDDELDTK